MSFLPNPQGEKSVEGAANLLGGPATFKAGLTSRLDAHEQILSGFPSSALVSLSDKVLIIRKADNFEKALGLSLRTFQRRKKDVTAKRLSPDQSGRAWKFAEILDMATDVLGSQQGAEEFLERPAIGLDGRRPMDLLASPAGIELVETYLGRMKYGVYA